MHQNYILMLIPVINFKNLAFINIMSGLSYISDLDIEYNNVALDQKFDNINSEIFDTTDDQSDSDMFTSFTSLPTYLFYNRQPIF